MGQNCTTTRYVDEVFDEVTVTSGIKFGEADPYGILGSQDLLLDLYVPTGDTLEKRPLLIYAFGGGFLIGLRNQPPIPQFCEHFARLGYVVASIDYRIGFTTTSTGSAERAVYRGVQDLRAAMRYLAQFSDGYGIDTTMLFLTGSSAGCFSALHSTFMTDAQRPQGTYGILLEPDDMGCSDCSGNTYLDNRQIRPKGIINNWGAILDTALIDPSAYDNVPVISFHGTDDLIVPYNSGSPFSYPVFPVVQGSAPIHQRLDNLGIVNRFVSLDGEGHEPWLVNASLLDTVYRHAAPFLYEIMRPLTSAITGDDTVPLGATRTYTVSGQAGSAFCWEVVGGNIVADNGTSVDVQWNTLGTWTLSVTEVSGLDVLGQPQTLDVEVVQPTSVASAVQMELGLYPNPTSGMLTVQLPEAASAQAWVRVFNAQGQMVHDAAVGVGQQRILLNMAMLPAGCYQLQLQDGKRMGSSRVLLLPE